MLVYRQKLATIKW